MCWKQETDFGSAGRAGESANAGRGRTGCGSAKEVDLVKSQANDFAKLQKGRYFRPRRTGKTSRMRISPKLAPHGTLNQQKGTLAALRTAKDQNGAAIAGTTQLTSMSDQKGEQALSGVDSIVRRIGALENTLAQRAQAHKDCTAGVSPCPQFAKVLQDYAGIS
jgi:hypothetical protein